MRHVYLMDLRVGWRLYLLRSLDYVRREKREKVGEGLNFAAAAAVAVAVAVVVAAAFTCILQLSTHRLIYLWPFVLTELASQQMSISFPSLCLCHGPIYLCVYVSV